MSRARPPAANPKVLRGPKPSRATDDPSPGRPALFFYADSGTALRCTGIIGYLRLSTTKRSYIHFFPGTHCPPTIGVVQQFLKRISVHLLGGGPCHCTGPTIVFILVLRPASIRRTQPRTGHSGSRATSSIPYA